MIALSMTTPITAWHWTMTKAIASLLHWEIAVSCSWGNHGILVVGRTLANAWDDLYYLERACKNQVLAMSTGLPLREIPTQLVQAAKNQILGDGAIW